MANKYHYDVKNCYYAVGTKQSNGSMTYGTPVALPGLVSMEMGAEGDTQKIRADGIDYLVLTSNNGYSGTLNFIKVDDVFKVTCLGEVVDSTTGIQYENADADPVPFALMGEFKGDDENIRWVYYNCVASRPGQAGENKDNMKEPDREELEVTASPVVCTIGEADVNIVRGGILASGNDDTYAAWFTKVCLPGTAV